MEFDVMQLISSGLFPIGMVLLMWKYLTEQEARTREIIQGLTASIIELKIMVETLNKNVSRETFGREGTDER